VFRFVVSFVYYALILGVGNLDSNVYISEILSGLVDVPAHLIYPWLLSRTWYVLIKRLENKKL